MLSVRKVGAVIGAVLFLTLESAQASELNQLLRRCAPDVHPTTMGALVRTESGGRQYALADAGPRHLPWRIRKTMVRSFYPATKEEAATIANELVAKGHIVAIGLTQVSSRNLKRLGLTVEQVLEACQNLRAGGQILAEFYDRSQKKYRDPNDALLAAISAYNTGNFADGFTNGYVNAVLAASGKKVPELRVSGSAGGQRYAEVGAGVPAPVGYARSARRRLLLEAKLAEIEVETY